MKKNKLYMLTIIFWSFLPFVFIGCGGGVDSDDDGLVYAEEAFFKKIELVNHDLLKIQGVSGSINVTGSVDANSVIVEGEMRAGSTNKAEAESYLDELDVEITDLGNEIFVETIQPKQSAGRNYLVVYNIAVPDELEVNVRQANGAVLIDGINNQVSVTNVNGDINLNEIFGNTEVNVANGHIASEVTLPLDGVIKMTIANGSINLQIPKNTSAMFAARSANGVINLSGLSLQDEVDIFNSISGTLGEGKGSIDLTTSNGNISLTGF